MTTDLQPDAVIEQAADFLRNTPPKDRPRPLVPAMREMFGLTPFETVKAIYLSREGGANGRAS